MQLWQYYLIVTARSLYMFRTLSAPIIRSTKNCSNSHWCMSWVRSTALCHSLFRLWHSAVDNGLGRPYWIYIISTHDMHQWLLLQFLVLLMMGAESVWNM